VLIPVHHRKQWNVHRDPDPASRWIRDILKERSAAVTNKQI